MIQRKEVVISGFALTGLFIVAMLLSISTTIATYSIISLPAATELQKRMVALERAKNVVVSTTLTVTAYSPRRRETDSTPFITASNKRVKEGTVAVSQDLFWKGWTFHRKVFIQCSTGKKGFQEAKRGECGIFEIYDVMDKDIEKSIDLLFFSTKKAYRVGRRTRSVILLAQK